MKKIKLSEKDLARIVKRTILESKQSKKKKTITVSENDLITSIEKIVSEQNAVLGFGNQQGLGLGIALPTSKYKDLYEDDDIEESEDELDEQGTESQVNIGGKETISVVDDPDATADGMGMFEQASGDGGSVTRDEFNVLKNAVEEILKTLKIGMKQGGRTSYRLKESTRKNQLKKLKALQEAKKKKSGKCPADGCVQKRSKGWIVISNDTGECWGRSKKGSDSECTYYKTKAKASGALGSYFLKDR